MQHCELLVALADRRVCLLMISKSAFPWTGKRCIGSQVLCTGTSQDMSRAREATRKRHLETRNTYLVVASYWTDVTTWMMHLKSYDVQSSGLSRKTPTRGTMGWKLDSGKRLHDLFLKVTLVCCCPCWKTAHV